MSAILWFVACHMHLAVALVYADDQLGPHLYLFPSVSEARAWVSRQPPEGAVYSGGHHRPWYSVIGDAAHEFDDEGDQCRFR